MVTEGSQCTCKDEAEHAQLVASIDESFRQDVSRAKMRTENNTSVMRARVLAEQNGHHDV